jgi:hypothetical protein
MRLCCLLYSMLSQLWYLCGVSSVQRTQLIATIQVVLVWVFEGRRKSKTHLTCCIVFWVLVDRPPSCPALEKIRADDMVPVYQSMQR